jgi:hypothetical protein
VGENKTGSDPAGALCEKGSKMMVGKLLSLLVGIASGALIYTQVGGQASLWQTHMTAATKSYQEGRYADAEKSLLARNSLTHKTHGIPLPSTTWRNSTGLNASMPRRSRSSSAHWQSERKYWDRTTPKSPSA